MMTQKLSIRKMEKSDCQLISEAFQKQDWDKPIEQFNRYYKEQEDKHRLVLVAFYQKEFSGYLTIVNKSNYPLFADSSIPEIVDFNVLKKFQRQKIGTNLMDFAEELIAETSDFVGIGVGLFSDYGNAQRLYVKRGYIPDGRGVFQDNKPLKYGDKVIVNHSLTLHFIKNLK